MDIRLSGGTTALRCPHRTEIHRGVARLPAAQEPCDRRMEHDLVEVALVEEPVPAHRSVLRGDRFERASRQIAREDDVHDVLRGECALRSNRVDDRDRPFDGQLVLDPDLFAKLAVQGIDEALAGVDAAAREEPVLAPVRLLMAAEENPVLPAQERRDADPRLHAYTFELPKPRTPRSLSGSSSTSTGSRPGTSRTTSWAMRIPGSTTNVSLASVFSSTTFSSPR